MNVSSRVCVCILEPLVMYLYIAMRSFLVKYAVFVQVQTILIMEIYLFDGFHVAFYKNYEWRWLWEVF